MGSKLDTLCSSEASDDQLSSVMIRKREELIIADSLLEEGVNDDDSTHLCLDRNLLEDSGHRSLGPKELEDVLATIGSTRRQLKKLSVMFNETQAQGVGRFLAADRSVRQRHGEIEAGPPTTTIHDMWKDNHSHVSRLATPTTLSLLHCSIGDTGARLLATGLVANTTLESLDLPHCNLKDDGATDIAHGARFHQLLSSLNLKNNSIGARGAMALAETLRINSVLHELILGGNEIKDAGAKALAEALTTNTTLTYLDLGNNGITETGGLDFAQGLAQNIHLRYLNLRGNPVGREACERVRLGWNERNAKQSSLRGQPWHDGLFLPM